MNPMESHRILLELYHHLSRVAEPAESFQGAPKAGVFSQTLLKALLGDGLQRFFWHEDVEGW